MRVLHFFISDTMKLYWIKTHYIIKTLFRGFVWDVPNNEKTVYLTFDDGPIPEVTEWVLNVLQEYGIEATFFCIGNNIEKYPDIFRKVVAAGHGIGNHTFNHLNGWETDTEKYKENVLSCEDIIQLNPGNLNNAKLFRPPYGKIKNAQAKWIRKAGYKIIMWDVLSADFDFDITPQQCLNNVINNTLSGSIILFHDSVKASVNLKFALPKTIEYLLEKGYQFKKIA